MIFQSRAREAAAALNQPQRPQYLSVIAEEEEEKVKAEAFRLKSIEHKACCCFENSRKSWALKGFFFGGGKVRGRRQGHSNAKVSQRPAETDFEEEQKVEETKEEKFAGRRAEKGVRE